MFSGGGHLEFLIHKKIYKILVSEKRIFEISTNLIAYLV
jgi:hypothetical protein